MTKIWETITHEFFDGKWPQESDTPTKEESDLIEYFITRPRYKNLLNKFVEEELIQISEQNYSNKTEVSTVKEGHKNFPL